MMEATDIGPGKNVRDIRCGAGHSSALINEAGATVVGVDAAQGMVDYAKQTFAGIDFQVGGLEELAFGDDEFDAVLQRTLCNTLRTARNRVNSIGGSNTCLLEGA
jgi:ubiquinone/menaquinone biosynthesis C-methylase UbiE